jgi:hypothetical protein
VNVVRFVLDTTAITAYAAGSVPVGELLTFLTEEDAYAAVPAVCLLQATADVLPSPGLLPTLIGHPRVLDLPLARPVSVSDAEWDGLARWVRLLGRLDQAVAAFAVQQRLDEGAYLVTQVPEVYGDLPVIGV